MVSPLVPLMTRMESRVPTRGTGRPVAGSATTVEFTSRLPPATTLTSPVKTRLPPPKTTGVPTVKPDGQLMSQLPGVKTGGGTVQLWPTSGKVEYGAGGGPL